MSKRIFYGKNTPLSFQENLFFSSEHPYTIRHKELKNDDIAPLHYSKALEVLLCCDISGTVTIESHRIPIAGDTVVVIPPYAVHSVSLNRGDGHVYVVHISFEELCAFLDIPCFLKQAGTDIDSFSSVCSYFEEVRACVMEMIERDDDLFARMAALLKLIGLLQRDADREKKLPLERRGEDAEKLKRIIVWASRHFRDKVSTSDAAEVAGFSKNYFCSWFRRHTGMTWNNYLNDVRISNACRILTKTASVTQACQECGFSDLSWFIQLFKKKRGRTPRQYVKSL